MIDPGPNPLQPSDNTPRWQVWGCLILMLAGLYLIVGPKIELSRWTVTPDGNTALEEALAWRSGTLTLSRSYKEDVHFNGKQYNVVGLAFVLLSCAGTALSDWFAAQTGWEGTPHDPFYPAFYVAMVALPVPFLGYWAFRTVGKSPPWAAVLTVYLIAGTSLRPVLTYTGAGSIYQINHVLAVSGLLLIAGDLLGRRRIWPALIGLALAAWSRQMTVLYAIAILGLAWERRATVPPTSTTPAMGGETLPPTAPAASAPRRRVAGRFYVALFGILLVAAVPMTLNTLKFGNPLNTGYPLIYDGQLDQIAIDAHRQFYGPDYLLRHAKAMFLAYPSWDIRGGQLYADASDIEGGSIWLTSPLLLAIFPTVACWWRDRSARALMLTSFLVMIAVMGYHTTGAQHAGYYRYSLDFIPVWLVVVAPYITTRNRISIPFAALLTVLLVAVGAFGCRATAGHSLSMIYYFYSLNFIPLLLVIITLYLSGRRWVPFTLACLACSALYFNIIPPP